MFELVPAVELVIFALAFELQAGAVVLSPQWLDSAEPEFELPAPVELLGLGLELPALGWVLPPQWLDPAMAGFEVELPAPVLELPLPWLHHPAQPNTPLSKGRKTPQTPQLQ